MGKERAGKVVDLASRVMSEMGQTRRFQRGIYITASPQRTDIFGGDRLVADVLETDSRRPSDHQGSGVIRGRTGNLTTEYLCHRR
jgi:hypothetical protein